MRRIVRSATVETRRIRIHAVPRPEAIAATGTSSGTVRKMATVPPSPGTIGAVDAAAAALCRRIRAVAQVGGGRAEVAAAAREAWEALCAAGPADPDSAARLEAGLAAYAAARLVAASAGGNVDALVAELVSGVVGAEDAKEQMVDSLLMVSRMAGASAASRHPQSSQRLDPTAPRKGQGTRSVCLARVDAAAVVLWRLLAATDRG